MQPRPETSEPALFAINEEGMRAALVAASYIVGPVVLCTALIWTQVDRPGALVVAGSVFAASVLLGGLCLLWRRRPPRSPHFATSVVICVLYLCTMAQMLAYPDPVLGSLHLIIAVGAAVFLIDVRWMLGVQLFGAATWALPVYLAPPSPQWLLQGYVLATGLAAAWAFRLARLHSMQRIDTLRNVSLERERRSRQAEEALRSSEARLVEAQRIARMGSFEWDLATQKLHWSDGAYRMFGWDPLTRQATVEDFYAAVFPEDRDALVEAVAESLRGGPAVDLEYRAIVGSEERVLHGRSETIFDATGQPVRHAGTTVDVTDRKHVELELRATEGRLRAILTALDAGSAVAVSRDGTVESILGEPPTTSRYGFGGDEVLAGKHILDFVPGPEGERLVARVAEVYEAGAPCETEVEARFPKGSFHFEVSLRAVRFDAADISSVLAVVRDVTERKRTEQTLQQTEKLESLGLMAGGIAHDFNNLLVGILSNSEAALTAVPGASPARRPLEDIVVASQRAAELTGELLSYAGESRNEQKSLNLGTLVDGIAQLIRASVPRGVSLEVEDDGARAWVLGDAAQLQQVAMNFITNAGDAVDPRSGRVTVRTGVLRADRDFLSHCYLPGEVEPGPFAVLQVSDDGAGMSASTLERIFDPFFTTKLKGRGLGLASTLGIVRSHVGTVRVESAPERGTTFWVLLPLTDPPAQTSPTAPTYDGVLREGTILVVDDAEIVRSGAARALESLGYEVAEAASGPEAVRLLKEASHVCAALVDVSMPGLDGGQTRDALLEIQPDLPVLFMSGHGPQEVARRFGAEAPPAHVRKPFEIAELAAALRDLLDDRAGRTELESSDDTRRGPGNA